MGFCISFSLFLVPFSVFPHDLIVCQSAIEEMPKINGRRKSPHSTSRKREEESGSDTKFVILSFFGFQKENSPSRSFFFLSLPEKKKQRTS